MLRRFCIYFSFCCIAEQASKAVMSQLTQEQIKDTFDNVMSDDYIKTLAKNFASKAAQHFVKEMRNQKQVLALELSKNINRKPNSDRLNSSKTDAQYQGSRYVDTQQIAHFEAEAQAMVHAQIQKQRNKKAQQQTQVTAKEEQEEEAKMMQEPSTQNDQQKPKVMIDSHEALNLLREPEPDGDHLDSENGELSDEEKRNRIPVIQVMKINGAYFRRLLGLI